MTADVLNRSPSVGEPGCVTQTAPADVAVREALERIAFLSTNHGGWFEADPFKAYAELGAIARAALGAAK